MRKIQQGDVLFLRVEHQAQGEPVKPKDGRVIIAEGEATGHAHATVAVEGVDLFREEDGTLYLVNSTGTDVDVSHEEHGTVQVPPGTWEIGGVVEFDPFEKIDRLVAD